MQSGLPMRKESQWSEILITGMNQPMSWKEENHWGFIPVLYRMCRSMLYTNIVSRHIKGNIFTRQILLQIMQSFVRETASRIIDISDISWSDQAWMEQRKAWKHTEQPMSIYEVHIGSWKKHPDDEDGFYNYREFAREITKYVKGYWMIPLLRLWALPSIPLTVPGDIR